MDEVEALFVNIGVVPGGRGSYSAAKATAAAAAAIAVNIINVRGRSNCGGERLSSRPYKRQLLICFMRLNLRLQELQTG